jgi:hypothetical protein
MRSHLTAVILLSFAASAMAREYQIDNPPEPTRSELLSAAKVDPASTERLCSTLHALLAAHPESIDIWLPARAESEMQAITAKLGKSSEPNGGQITQLVNQLKMARPLDPARQVDAILKQIGEVGDASDVLKIGVLERGAQTLWGKWKVYAALQQIMSRAEPSALVATFTELGPHMAATLLRDLEPQKAGEIASAYDRAIAQAGQGPWAPHVALVDRIWLAWSIRYVDPKRAAEIFTLGMTSSGPALRLFAGMGMTSLTDEPIPFRFTAPPDSTQRERDLWLSKIRPRAPISFNFPDPLSEPIRQDRYPAGVDLIWLNSRAEIVRREEDAWPTVRRVLPDGTYYSRLPNDDAVGLTSPTGDVIARFRTPAWFNVEPTPTEYGGFISWQGRQGSCEIAPTGEVMWSFPDAGTLTPMPRGQFLARTDTGIQALDRRGEVVWKSAAAEGDEVRRATLIAPKTILVEYKEAVEIHHLTDGKVMRIDGFRSVVFVRYHPRKPWLISDAGSTMKVYDPISKEIHSIDIMLPQPRALQRSRWLKTNQRYPDGP